MSRSFLLMVLLISTGCTASEQAVVMGQLIGLTLATEKKREPILLNIACKFSLGEEVQNGNATPLQKNIGDILKISVVDKRPKAEIIGQYCRITDIALKGTDTIDSLLAKDIINIAIRSNLSRNLDTQYYRINRLIFNIKLLEAWVEQPAGFSWFKTPIVSRVIFVVNVADEKSGQTAWEKAFVKEVKKSVFFASPNAFEETMTQAYCGALESFAKVLEGEEFADALK